jgi:hypothetical protein
MSTSKKILLVSAAFHPELSPRSFRATELAVELSRQGHTVQVITRNRNYNYEDFGKKNSIAVKELSKQFLPVIKTGGKGIYSLFKRIINRMLLMLVEYPDIELLFKTGKALSREDGYDLLISFAVPYPVHWGVAKARNNDHRIARVWVADCGDPYMNNITDSFHKFFYFRYIEKWFFRKTDYISIPAESARQGYYAEFQDKIRIIPQGIRFPENGQLKGYIKKEIPTFAYAGGFISGIRDPRKFLGYLASVDQAFKFIVFTNQPDLLESYIPVLKEKIEIYGYIPRYELIKKLATMDFLVNFDNNTGVQIPSKLIDYALTDRPILNIKKELNSGIINEFLSGNYEHKMVIEHIEQYNILNVVQQFIQLT